MYLEAFSDASGQRAAGAMEREEKRKEYMKKRKAEERGKRQINLQKTQKFCLQKGPLVLQYLSV